MLGVWLYLLFNQPEMTLRLRLIILAFFAILSVSCSKKEKSDTEESLVDNDTFVRIRVSGLKLPKLKSAYKTEQKAHIDHFAKRLWNDNDNVSFLVARNGQILYEKYQGYGDRNTKQMIDSRTPLHIASVSKVMTAAAILQLVNRHKIKLDQKVNTILKTFPYPEITIRTLLNHRSGLRNYAYFTSEPGVWDTHKTLTNQDILRLLSEKNIQLQYPTNTHFAYCNTNYAMLALVIEKITAGRMPRR
jgi:CubicO group peptidase (beta-lactamase class C family)